MGITRVAVDFLLRCRAQGMTLGRTVTIGRQWFLMSPAAAREVLQKERQWPADLDPEVFERELAQLPYYVDPFLKTMGATSVASMDISAFEGAELIHDLNQPIPQEWHEKYDFLLDGGSIEHVFNFPVAIKNYMEMVKVGGSLVVFTVANNFFGHGFYQFSPELFYRIFSPENGFKLERLEAVEDDMVWSRIGGFSYPVNVPGNAYEVADPAAIGERVELVNQRQTALLIWARRVEKKPIFQTTPQQSDYVAAWKDKKESNLEDVRARARSWVKAIIGNMTPARLLHLQHSVAPRMLRLLNPFLLSRFFAKESFRNRRAFKRVKK